MHLGETTTSHAEVSYTAPVDRLSASSRMRRVLQEETPSRKHLMNTVQLADIGFSSDRHPEKFSMPHMLHLDITGVYT